jgi:hypothetical protein
MFPLEVRMTRLILLTMIKDLTQLLRLSRLYQVRPQQLELSILIYNLY